MEVKVPERMWMMGEGELGFGRKVWADIIKCWAMNYLLQIMDI